MASYEYSINTIFINEPVQIHPLEVYKLMVRESKNEVNLFLPKIAKIVDIKSRDEDLLRIFNIGK